MINFFNLITGRPTSVAPPRAALQIGDRRRRGRWLGALGALLALADLTAVAQPTVLGTQVVNGTYTTYDLNVVGGFRQRRLQATSGAATGLRNWEFVTGTAGAPNYTINWRPYTAGQTLSAYDTQIDPSSAPASARYNGGSGGQSGLLPAVVANNYYTFNVGALAPTNNNFMAVLQTTYNPVTISTVTTATASYGLPLTVTATTSGVPNANEFIYLRYSFDGFATSGIVRMQQSTSTTTFAAMVPTGGPTGAGTAAGATVSYYVFSSNQSTGVTHANADMLTLNLNNNSGSNYTALMPVSTIFFEPFDIGTWSNAVGTPANITSTGFGAWTTVGTGNNQWQRNDYTTGWTSGSGGSAFTAANGLVGTAARFHSFDAVDNTTGDLISPTLNFSAAGTKMLTFSMINTNSTNANEKVEVALSTDNGATYGSVLGTFTTYSVFTQVAVNLGTSTATQVKIRLRATSDFGTTDIGVDNFLVTNATPMSGAYTINNTLATAGTNFNNFGDAFAALKARGISGAVTFTVSAGQTFNESPLSLPVVFGSSSSNTITFVKASGANPIVQSALGTGTTDAVITLNGTDYVTFNGIDLRDNGTTATNRMERGLYLNSTSGTDGTTNIAYRNGTITLDRTQANFTTGIYSFSNASAAGGQNSNLTVVGSTIQNAQRGIQLLDGSATFPATGTVIGTMTSGENNIITNIGGSSAIGIEYTNQSGLSIQNNALTSFNVTGASVMYGINTTSNSGSAVTISNNQIGSGFTSTATASAVYGIYLTSGATATASTISNNTVTSLAASATSIPVAGIYVTSLTANITGNTVSGLSLTSAGSNSALFHGIYYTLPGSGNTVNVARNYVHSLTYSTTGTGIIRALRFDGSGATANINNNLIANLSSPASTGGSGATIRAIDMSSSSATLNVYYNTVYLQGTATQATNQTAALYFTTGPTTVDYRNNILVNRITGGTRHVAVLRTTTAIPSNIGANVNNNLLQGTNGLLYDNTNTYSTLATYRAYLTGGRESAAVTETNTPFVSTTDPHLTTANATQAEAGAQIISVTDDYDAVGARTGPYPLSPTPSNGGGQLPDIGADEGNFIPLDLSPPTITIGTPLTNTTSLTAPTLTNVTITDNSGVNTTLGTRPRVYYKLSTEANAFVGNTSADNGWKFVEATGTTSPFSFNLNFALLTSTPAAGSVIQYFVVAQDLAGTPNVGINSVNTFAATPASVALTGAAAPIGGTALSYTILEAFSGTITLGPGQNYNGTPLTTITAAGGLFARLNAGALTGNLIVEITGNISTEDGTNVLNPLTESPAASNFTITIRPAATATPFTITGAGGSMGVNGITLNGADRVTFDGRVGSTGTGKLLLFRNTTITGPVFNLIQDATNNEIRNCLIEGGTTSAGNAAVFFGNSQTTAVFNSITAGNTGNDFNKLTNCDVYPASGSSLGAGFYSQSSLSTASNSDNEITGNNFYNWTTWGAWLGTSNGGNWKINNNRFYQTASTSSTQMRAIELGSFASATSFEVKDNIIGGAASDGSGTWTNTGSGSVIRGIFLNALATSATTATNVIIQNNTIQNITQTSASGTTMSGIEVSNNSTFFSLLGNTIQDLNSASTTTSNTTPAVAGIVTASTAGNVANNAQTILGNTIQRLNTTGTAAAWAVGIVTKTSSVQTGNISFNRIANLTNGSTLATAGIIGIHLFDGTWVVINNQIALTNGSNPMGLTLQGIRDDTRATLSEKFYFNSIRIGGNSTSGSTVKNYAYVRVTASSTDLRNNILINERTGNGNHFAVGINNTTSFTSNYNDLYVSADVAKLGEVGTTAYNFANWKTNSGSQDANSVNVDARFVDETIGNLNLDVTTNCALNNTGVVISGINGEFDNVATSRATTPDIGSDEFSYTQQTASITTTGPICGTTSASITLNGGNGPYSLTYTNGVTPTNLTNQAGPTVTFSAAQSGTPASVTYTLTSATDAYGCSLSITGSPLVVNTPATADAGPATAAICAGTNYVLSGTIGGGATGGTWTTSGDGTFSPNATTLGATYVPGTADVTAGTVTLTLSSTGQTAPCVAATDNLVLTINPRPTATLSNNGPICSGTAATVSIALTGTGPWTFTYTDGVTPTTVTGTSTNPYTFSTGTLTANATYSLTALSDANCSAASLPTATTVTVNPRPTATLSNNGPICSGTAATVSIALTGTGPWTFTYTDGVTPTTVTGTSTNPYTFSTGTLTANATYSLTALSDANCSAASLPTATTVTVNPLPTFGTAKTDVLCNGAANGTIIVTAAAGTGTYQYSLDNGSNWVSGTNPYTFTGLAPATYQILVRNAGGGQCVAAAGATSVTITEPTLLTAAPSATTTCTGSSVGTITVNATGGTGAYTYSLDNGVTFPYNTNVITGLAAATYQLVVKDANNCTTAPQSVAVNSTSTLTWNGSVNSDWYTAANWTPNCVPSSTLDAVIPSGSVVIGSGTATVRDLDIQGGATLAVNGSGNLDVYGTFTTASAGSFTATSGTTHFRGSGAQPIPAGSYFNVALTGATPKVLAGNAALGGDLDLTNGLLELGNFNLTLADNRTITGYDNQHFVITNGTGKLVFRSVGGGDTVTFPIGTTSASSDYTPARLTNTGTADDFAGTVSDVIPQGPTPQPGGPHVVKKTWDISEAVAGGSNASLTLGWNTANEGASLVRTLVAVSHFVSGVWDHPFVGWAPAVAGTFGSQWQIGRNGLTSFSPFAVQDANMPLPVELTRFAAEAQGADALLTWATASERNSKGFEVQVSSDQSRGANSWRTLGFVASETPNSSTARQYRFVDTERGKTGVRYYRLQQVDLDGRVSYSNTRTVVFGPLSQPALAAWPNPFRGELTVELAAVAAGEAGLQLIDALGRVVWQQTVPVTAGVQLLTPALPTLPAGTYVLTATVGGQQLRSRLVKD